MRGSTKTNLRPLLLLLPTQLLLPRFELLGTQLEKSSCGTKSSAATISACTTTDIITPSRRVIALPTTFSS